MPLPRQEWVRWSRNLRIVWNEVPTSPNANRGPAVSLLDP